MNENLPESHISNRERFVAFAFSSADILLELDGKGAIRFMDGASNGLLGFPSSHFIGTQFTDLVHEDDREQIQKILSSNSGKSRLDDLRIRIKNSGDQDVYFALSGYQLPYLGGSYFITLSHLKVRVRSEDVAQRDFRTGLLNREAFTWEANKRLMNAKTKGNNVQMSMVDLSGISSLITNIQRDKFDGLMGQIADYLKSISIDGDTAAVIDANQFGIIHGNSIQPGDISNKVKEIVKRELKPTSDPIIRAETLDMAPVMINDYDAAKVVMYTISKFANQHGDRFSLSSLTDGYQEMLGETIAKMGEFKDIINEGRFQVAFQPIMNLDGSEAHHFEALVRLVDSDLFDSPLTFITFGEKAGFIGEFDLAMCHRVIGQLKEVAAENQHPMVSVNISGRSLSSRLFREALKAVLESNADVRPQIFLEITESARITEPVLVNDFLQELRDGGTLCCLDDFGSAESSFDYIRAFDIDYVKIDGSYVRNCLISERSRYLFKSMVAICHELKIETVAEMVESKEIAEFLKTCGVNYGQGYHYEKPNTDFKGLLEKHKYATRQVNTFKAAAPRKFKDNNKLWWKKEGDSSQPSTHS
jgi:EAL domain-containing protein (putative c-di-GMP-specific phosphodiesterase class I)/PAS domain-containing protein